MLKILCTKNQKNVNALLKKALKMAEHLFTDVLQIL